MQKIITNKFRGFLIIPIVVLSLILTIEAQNKTNYGNPAKITSAANSKKIIALPIDLIAFFVGEWEGVGQFSDGRKIKADARFIPELDNQLLLYSHQDRPPNSYKSFGRWEFERSTRRLLMNIQDNSGSIRQFKGDGWKDGKVIFIHDKTAAIPYLERFIFERQTKESFKLTYETSKNGKDWQMGDYLNFTLKIADPELRKELITRLDEESQVRNEMDDKIKELGGDYKKISAADMERWMAVDRKNTVWIKEIMLKSGWLGKNLVGVKEQKQLLFLFNTPIRTRNFKNNVFL